MTKIDAQFVHYSAEHEGPRRSVTILVWGSLIALLSLLGMGLLNRYMDPVEVGDSAPNFILTTFDGAEIQLTDLKGKVIVVNFWASWCMTCREEAAELEAAHQAYKDRNVVFLGVNYADSPRAALDYLRRFEITYLTGPDLGTRISQTYRVRAVPETYVIGLDGRITAVKIGPYSSIDELAAQIERGLGGD